MTTKVEAVQRVLAATWSIIYANIAGYYPAAKDSNKWMAGIIGQFLTYIADQARVHSLLMGYSEVEADTIGCV